MKTFFNLVQEVQKPGLCSRCGGCAVFCNAINYGALEINKKGKPVYGNIEKCIECGLCYSICPEIKDLDDQTKRQAAWSEPMGRVIDTTVVRSTEKRVLDRASDGGAVTALLLHLFERSRIDGAIVSRPVGRFQREPYLATTPEEILDAAGIFFDSKSGIKPFSDEYMTFSTIREFETMVKKGLKRVALVGTPCQIKSLRKMQVLNLIPSDSVRICLGLFCSGNYTFGLKERQHLAKTMGISWDDVVRVNLKDQLIVWLASGDKKTMPVNEMETMKRYACHYCSDYSAEFSDISFGGLGAREGWTTIISRTPLGRAVLADCRSAGRIEQFSVEKDSEYASFALKQVRNASLIKKKNARYNRRILTGKSVQVKV